MGRTFRELRRAVRTLAKRPTFSLVAILVISVGIGANTAIFSVVNGVLLRPVPLPESERLVVPNVHDATTHFGISVSIPNFRDWRDRNRTFSEFAAHMSRSRTLTGLDQPSVVRVRMVIGDFFETLRTTPFMGRLIQADETFEGAPNIAVVSHGFWTRRLGEAPDAIGRAITLDGEVFTIVGVTPEDFRFPSADSEVFLPMGFFADRMCWENRGCSQGTAAFARLSAGTSIVAAQEDLDRIRAELESELGGPVAYNRLETLADNFIGDLRSQIWLLMGAVTFLLLIATANVGSLMLAWGESRRREIAIRTAIGAGRTNIIRQFLAESLVLAFVSGALGVAFAAIGLRLMSPSLADAVPSVLMNQVSLDPWALLFTGAITLTVGIFFGVAPAIRSGSIDLNSELREGGGRGGTVGRARQRGRSALVSTQVALSLMLLVGAGLMVQSLANLRNVDRGFEGEGVLTAEVSLPSIRYGNEKREAWEFFDRFRERIETLPGAQAVSFSNIVPLAGSSWEQGIYPEGMAITAENTTSVLFNMMSLDHFDVLGIDVVQGRAFNDLDREGSALVAIIDETMAEAFWPGEDPIGKRVTFETETVDEQTVRIYRDVVGVTRNVRHYELQSASRVQIYVPMSQSGRQWTTSMMLLVKTAGPPLEMTELVRRELRSLDPEVPLADIRTMENIVDGALSSTRVIGILLAAFSSMAILLSGIGLFGVVSFSAAQRLREIGIRVALGAEKTDVLRLVASQGMGITGVGVLIGIVGAALLSGSMSSQLFQVAPMEPLIYGSVTVFLVLVSALASYLPARRATSVDPSTVLRDD